MSASPLVTKLLDRLYERWQKQEVKEFLESIRDKHDLTNRQLSVSGTLDDLRDAFVGAIGANYITVKDLAKLVDRLEENGNQHVFLFDFAEETNGLSIVDALKVFKPVADTPEEEFYSQTPDNLIRARLESPTTGALVIKQTHTTSYWKTLDTKTEGRIQTIRREQIDRRAVNILRIEPARRRAEIRIARLGADDSDKQVAERLNTFFTAIAPFVNVKTALIPLPLWDAYHLIAIDRDETLMKWDNPSGGQHSIRFMSRFQHIGFWDDIRDSEDYPKAEPVYARDEVRIYWVRGAGEEREAFEVRLSDLKLKPMRFGKVEFFDVLEPDAVSYVIGRVRNFVDTASN